MKSSRLHTLIVAGICFAIAVDSSTAQPKLYKHVDANGKVTYTDRPDEPDEKILPIANTARNGNNPPRGNAKTAGKAEADAKTKTGNRKKGGGQRGQKNGGGAKANQPQPPD